MFFLWVTQTCTKTFINSEIIEELLRKQLLKNLIVSAAKVLMQLFKALRAGQTQMDRSGVENITVKGRSPGTGKLKSRGNVSSPTDLFPGPASSGLGPDGGGQRVQSDGAAPQLPLPHTSPATLVTCPSLRRTSSQISFIYLWFPKETFSRLGHKDAFRNGREEGEGKEGRKRLHRKVGSW